MTTAELDVYLDGVRCGVLRQSSGGNLTFDYEDAYRAGRQPTPLSLSMPLAIATHANRVVRPFFAGLLTDNPQARAALAREYGVSLENPFALLSHVGADVAGALQILPPGVSTTDGGGLPASHTLLGPHELETLLLDTIAEYREGMPGGGPSQRFSLAGAQPKVALHRCPDGWARPDTGTPTTHIIKPVAGEYRRLDVVEHLTMRAAGHLGLSVAQTSLSTFGEVRAFVTARYDRRRVGDRWIRVHQEDLCQALGFPPEKKYQHLDGGPGVGAVARLFKSLPLRADREETARDFFRGLMFNTVLECNDAHAKNYSLILVQDRVRLAPLYDLVTYAPYGRPTYAAMQIGGEYEFAKIGEAQCLKAAKTLGVDQSWARDQLDALRRGAAGAFEAARDDLVQADSDTREAASLLVDAVAGLRLVR
ncbi:HipA domain-containing protein [Jiangella anatolica]|uniref:Type II toxin-antitoxin system HipA family toxin n=1 Tax=Jiangella anatolica TaxID=2670374 RepID=A0A2W2BGI6_9ACTN|nr:HipA domain-containing protein [Jiangella anatolica]PZF79398.1 type II toxin-antitoxin system HipA family toxin [Jiangella anatolica]